MKLTTRIKLFLANPFSFVIQLITLLPYFRFIRETQDHHKPITFGIWFRQKIMGFNRGAYWPVHFTSSVKGAENIYIGVGTSPGYNPCCYIQGAGKLYFGNYTNVGQNTTILAGNHDIYNHRNHIRKVTKIGSYCWIGNNCVILPGVVLGDFTVVGAGSVVTQSYPEGCCVVAGNPAKFIKKLDKNKLVKRRDNIEYQGYMRKEKFANYRKYLNV